MTLHVDGQDYPGDPNAQPDFSALPLPPAPESKPAPPPMVAATATSTGHADRIAPPAILKWKPGTPISNRAWVGNPPPIKELASWSVELAGHTNYMESVAIHPDGVQLASVGLRDATIRFWRFNDGIPPVTAIQQSRVCLGETEGLWSCAYSHSGEILAVSSQQNRRVALYDCQTGRQLKFFDLELGGSRHVVWSPDDRYLAAPNFTCLSMIDVETGQIRHAESRASFVSAAWSPIGDELVTLDESGTVRFFEAHSLKILAESQEVGLSGSEGLAWSPDSRLIVTGGLGGRLFTWDPVTRRRVTAFDTGLGHDIHSLEWEPRPVSGKPQHQHWPRLLMAGNVLQIWNPELTERLVDIPMPWNSRRAVWSHDGRRVIGAAMHCPQVHDAATGTLLGAGQALPPMTEQSTFQASQDGKILRITSRDNLLIHNAETGEFVRRIGNLPGAQLALSPKDDWLVSYDSLKTAEQMTLIDTATYEQRVPLVGHVAEILVVSWSPDGKLLATGGKDRKVLLWNVGSTPTIAQTFNHERGVTNLAWSPDGKQLATCTDDDVVRVWSVKSGEVGRTYDRLPARTEPGPRGMAWSPSGDLLAFAPFSAQAVILDLKSAVLSDPLIKLGSAMLEVAWSPDGKQLLAANGNNGSALGYRSVGANSSQVVEGHGTPIQWLPDSRRVLTGPTASTPLQAVDTRRGLRLGALFPVLANGGWLCIGADGHYRGSEGVESQIVYVALHKDGSQTTHSPAEFAERYKWKNDPTKATFLKLREGRPGK